MVLVLQIDVGCCGVVEVIVDSIGLRLDRVLRFGGVLLSALGLRVLHCLPSLQCTSAGIAVDRAIV